MEIVLASELVTYIVFWSREYAVPWGRAPVGIVFASPVSRFTAASVPLLVLLT